MAKLDIVIFIFLGVLQVISAAWGGIVSAKSLQDTPKVRRFHIAAFSLMALLGGVLVVMQGMRTYYQQKDAKTNHERDQGALTRLQNTEDATQSKLDSTREELHQSALRQENMKGQLEILRLGISGGSSSIAQAIKESATKPSAEQMTNARLCEKAKDIATRMIEVDSRYMREQQVLSAASQETMNQMMLKGVLTTPNGKFTEEGQRVWDKHSQDQVALYFRHNDDAYREFFAEAKFLEQEIALRLPHPTTMREPIFLRGGILAGIKPLSEAGAYLITGANQLCQETPKQQK